MARSREGRVYRVRQLPLYLDNGVGPARFLARVAPLLGTVENILVFSLAHAKQDSMTATVGFNSLPSIFDNNEEQWTLQTDIPGRNIIVDIHFRDFTVLGEPRRSPHTADCIAISGLASHPFGSWKHRESGSDFMWLRDRLPQDVPQLRSLIYGYDTKLFKSRSFQDLDDIARTFIASLKELRRSLPPARPLFFLAHSLGGIVLKRAIVLLSYDGGGEEKMILDSVKGIIFLGVPHRGMEISHFLAMAAKQPNEDLISKTLSPDSALLPELDESFSKVTSAIKQNMRFVYETAESQLTEASLLLAFQRQLLILFQQNQTGAWVRSETSYKTLVSKDSAIPVGVPRCHTIAVNEDHSNMVKFGEDDSVYQKIRSFLFDLSMATHVGSHTISHNSLTLHSSGCISPPTLSGPIPKRVATFSTVPFPRDPSFVGREDIIAKLDCEFADPKSQHWASLYGLGGIGKSQIAIEYSYRQEERNPQISTFWVHASSKARFEQSFTDIATTAAIPGSGDGKIDVLQLVSKRLANQSNGHWLLILDNADDANVLLDLATGDTGTGAAPVQRRLLDFLPRVQHGTVLITTRDRTCALLLNGYDGTPIEVLAMNMDDSVILLRNRLPDAHQADACELVKELENIPLAISQASAYIKEVPRVSIPRYLEILRSSNKRQVALLTKNKHDKRRDAEVPNAVAISWGLSFDQIRRNSPDSADLFSLMSYFNRQSIPKFLIQGEIDEESFEEKVNVLVSFSLIRVEIGEDTFGMHRLVKTAMQQWLYSEGQDQMWKDRAIERVAHLFPFGNDQWNQWAVCEALMSHVDEVITYNASSKYFELDCAKIMVCTAFYLTERKGYDGLAEQRVTHALQIHRQHLDEDSVEIVNALEVLALAKLNLFKFEEAISIQEDILETRLKKWGPEHQCSLTAMHNLASSSIEMGRLEKAEDLLKRVVATTERLGKSEDSQYLTSGNALADVHLGHGNYAEAERLSTRLVETSTKLHGFEHIDTLVAMSNLSVAYRDQDKFEDAESLIAKTISASVKLFDPSHWRTLEATRILAHIYFKQSKLDEAKEICLLCFDTALEVHGSQNPTIISIKSTLGLIYRNKGELIDALEILKDTAESSRELYGTDHPETLIHMYNLALCNYSVGDKNRAVRLMTEVLEKRRKVLRAEHPHTILSAKLLEIWKSMEGESEDLVIEEGAMEDQVFEEDFSGQRESDDKGSEEEESEKVEGEEEELKEDQVRHEQSVDAQLSSLAPKKLT